MFLSELQSHSPSDPLALEDSGNLTGLEMFMENSNLERECNKTVSDSSPTSSVTTSPVPLECTPTDLFIDPMDNPFLSNFTDVNVLQEDFPLLTGGLEKPSPLLKGVLDSSSPVERNDVKVDVIDSSECSVSSTEQKLLNLSECIDLLNASSATPITSISPSPSSPVTGISSTASSPETPPQNSLFLCDFDFSAISEECLASLISTSELMTPFPVTHVQLAPDSPRHETPPTSHDTTPTCSSDGQLTSDCKPCRKRKSSVAQLPPNTTSKVVLVSSDSEAGDTDKCKVRRDKNNKASQVSRAKRKQRHKNMAGRVGELEDENEKLRVQEKELTAEIEKMKKLLLDRLTQQK